MIAAVLGLVAAFSGAQEPPAGAPGGRRGPGPGPGRPARDEAFKMIDAYVVSNLQDSLGLTDDQFVKLLPLVRHLQTDRRAVTQKRQESLMEMRRLLASGTATEAQIVEVLQRVKSAESDEAATLKRDRDAIDGALSAVQQAKFRVLELEVDRKIRELMVEIRAQRRGPGRDRGPGGPPVPEPEP